MCPIGHQIISIQRTEGEFLAGEPLGKMFGINRIRLARGRSQLPGHILHGGRHGWGQNHRLDLDRGCSLHTFSVFTQVSLPRRTI